jgi:hypothetical protein
MYRDAASSDATTEAGTPRSEALRNPVKNHEPEGLDSGDQMPAEPSWWGDRYGRQSLLAGTELPRERWLVACLTWWRERRNPAPRSVLARQGAGR